MPATTIEFLRERLTRAPRALLVLGSGVSLQPGELSDPLRIPYAEIPGFPRSTIAGHPGQLEVGIWHGVETAIMRGRFHLYEGWSARDVALPFRVFRALGVDHVLLTNAAGGLRADLAAGDLMLIVDHLNLTFRNPLWGATAVGEERFPDMSEPYDPEARYLALEAADEAGVRLHQGVYAAVLGPSYETRAELKALRACGADAVGMSTVLETITARALGMKVLAISCITNETFGAATSEVTHAEVLEVASRASASLLHVLKGVLPRWVPANLPTEAAS